MIRLNVNIDHIATIRNARGGNEPDPVVAASFAELAGASGIVCHLREDRRHINDRDLRLLREIVQTKLDLEMAANEEIIQIALQTRPELVTIVPEKRQELTTEGGLDVFSQKEKLTSLCERMHERGIEVSLFVEPEEKQITAAKEVGADMVELHTGTYANARTAERFKFELNRIINAAAFAGNLDLKVAAGHGLNYYNTKHICFIYEIEELSIGHSIISRAAFVGIERAVKEMIELINNSTLHRNIDI
ncbi:MAG TPA: pyridoxine 5'-phosphate synthase [Candidatus Kapabacteria bacterium]|nr:pyridoxine 5'-phosphate synthase [Candidatus Kapabacteria bacterium]HPU24195.1 pyridoxine 5'-phosphate synthase [Candidatus Kapabacteria bacterium]